VSKKILGRRTDSRLTENGEWDDRLLGEQFKILSQAEIEFKFSVKRRLPHLWRAILHAAQSQTGQLGEANLREKGYRRRAPTRRPKGESSAWVQRPNFERAVPS
jgi:hypothetical protein